jgi:hypothetical protein
MMVGTTSLDQLNEQAKRLFGSAIPVLFLRTEAWTETPVPAVLVKPRTGRSEPPFPPRDGRYPKSVS